MAQHHGRGLHVPTVPPPPAPEAAEDPEDELRRRAERRRRPMGDGREDAGREGRHPTPGAAVKASGGTRCVADAADGYRSIQVAAVTGRPALRADAAVGQHRPGLCCSTRSESSPPACRSRRRRRAPWRSPPCSSVVSPGPCSPPSSSRAGSTPCATPSRACRRPRRCWRRSRRACPTRRRPSPTSWCKHRRRRQDRGRRAAGLDKFPRLASLALASTLVPTTDAATRSGRSPTRREGGRPAAVPQEPRDPRRSDPRRGGHRGQAVAGLARPPCRPQGRREDRAT